MIDIAMNRPALPRATDFGKTPRMDSPTVKRFLPWVVAMALFMEQLDSTIVNTAVPSMAASLHVTPLSLKAVVASYILSLAVCIPVSGWIADRYGTRRVFAIAIAVFTISYDAAESLTGIAHQQVSRWRHYLADKQADAGYFLHLLMM
jgi:MFS family permease